MTKKVSVIVPIYDVEKYLSRCVDSIINQSYADLEIILVNDGSTDNCLEICKAYSERDPRIVVIDKNNGGLSSARNAGLDNATGEYIMFVDSDDWIRKDAVELLLEDLIESGALMAIGLMKKCSEYADSEKIDRKSEIIDKNLAITRMLKGEWLSACAKLYHKFLFDGIRFPVGRTNEDYAILIYVFEKVNYVVLNPNEIYFYYTRPNSICTSSLNIRKFDEFYNGVEVYEYIKSQYPQMKQWRGYALANVSCSMIKLIGEVWNLKDKGLYKAVLQEMLEYLRLNFKVVFFNPYLNLKYKVFLLNIYLGKPVYMLFKALYMAYLKFKDEKK